MLNLLEPIAHSQGKEVVTDPGRVTAADSLPLEAQFLDAQRADAIELALDRILVCSEHG